MKRLARLLLLICAGLLASVVSSSMADAADKHSYQLSPNEIVNIANGLSGIEGYTKIVKDERGQDVAKIVPFTFKNNGVRLTLAQDIANLRAAFAIYQTAAKGLSESDTADLGAKKQPVELLMIDIRDLDIAANPYSPNAISLLLPITEPPKEEK